jgi:hypothetical protein
MHGYFLALMRVRTLYFLLLPCPAPQTAHHVGCRAAPMQCNKLSSQLGAHTHALPASCAQHSRAAGADPLRCFVLCTLARFLGCLWCCLAPTTLGSLLLEPWCPPALARCCRYRRSAAAMAAADPPTITHCWSSTSTRAPARLFAAAARARCHHPIPAALCATHS